MFARVRSKSIEDGRLPDDDEVIRDLAVSHHLVDYQVVWTRQQLQDLANLIMGRVTEGSLHAISIDLELT